MAAGTAAKAKEAEGTAPTEEDLADQIAALKADIARISETLGAMGRARADDTASEVRRRVEDARDEVGRRASQAESQAQDMVDEVSDMVRRRPGLAVGVAVGLGFIFGFMSSRR